MFEHHLTIRLRDTDAAGVLYFANQLGLAHEAYEALLCERGVDFARLVREGRTAIPLVRAEADFLAPLHLGDRVCVGVRVERLGSSSFTLAYELRVDGELVGRARTVHVAIDAVTRARLPLPDDLRAALSEP